MKNKSLLNMRIACILVFLICTTSGFIGNATNYYVSKSGSDTNSGTSPVSPWQSLEQVSTFSFSPGDTVFFKRGDSWKGTLEISVSGEFIKPVVFSAYGTGDKPVITGSEEVTGWTTFSGNIFKTEFKHRVGQVFIDGQRVKPARFPDEGYVYVDSVLNETTFYSAALNPGFDYTGALWYGRTIYWHGVLRSVTASGHQTITLHSPPERDLGPREGF